MFYPECDFPAVCVAEHVIPPAERHGEVIAAPLHTYTAEFASDRLARVMCIYSHHSANQTSMFPNVLEILL